MTTAHLDSTDRGLALSQEQSSILQQLPASATWADAAHTLVFDIKGELEPQRLQRALDRLLHGQQALGSRLGAAPGYRGLRQFVESGFQSVELAVGEATELGSLLGDWLAQPFQSDNTPLLRAAAYRREAGQWSLFLGIASSISDAASLPIVQALLIEAYASDAVDEEEPAQFAQYLEWRAEVVQDEDATTAKAYWQAHLNHAASDLLPPYPAYRSAPLGEAIQVIEKHMAVASLKSLSARLAQPAEVILQAAWWLLLAKVSGREAFLAGWRHDAREDYEYFQGTAGVFEKLLPLSVTIAPQESFAEWAGRLAVTLDEHRTWQEYWASEVGTQMALNAYTFSSRRALPEPRMLEGAWLSQARYAPARQGDLHLQVEVGEEQQALKLTASYAATAYSAAAVEGLLEQYGVLLDGLLEGVDRPSAELSLLGRTEHSRLLALGAGADLPLEHASLAQLIGAWAQRTPEASALVSEQQILSYGQLHEQALRVAGYLQTKGIAAGDIVALALPRSSEWVVAMLGTWYAGAGYLALDPQWPAARQALIVQEAKAALVLGHAAVFDGLAAHGINIEPLAQALGWDSSAVAAQPLATDTAYVLFTSGTTGTPKGVVIEHGQLSNYVAAAGQALGFDTCKHFAFGSTVAADLGHTALFGALSAGAALHIADDATFQDPQAFARFIQEQAIDFLKIVPSHLAALLEHPQAQVPATVVLGGEAATAEHLLRIRALRPDGRVFNHYGPTETTVGVMVHPMVEVGGGIPLSQVLAGNRIYVLDEQLELVATGQLGELYVGGRQLCRGYLNGQKNTESAFISDPFVAGERLYRTGDLARYRPEGGIQLAGRRDQQVKIRGYRIELSEIEEQLRSMIQVTEALVLAEPVGEQGSELQLIAFVVPREQAGSELASILGTGLQQRLPAVMVPGHIQFLSSLPRLANGKIDRQALVASIQRESACEYLAPRTALEELLAGRMAKLLGQERLSVNQDFFAAGGHSLLVIKLVAGIRKLLQREVQPAIVFDNPSVAALSQALLSQDTVPGQLEKIAQLRLKLDAMSPEEKARLTEKARQQSNNPA